jgi:hypothetical protein
MSMHPGSWHRMAFALGGALALPLLAHAANYEYESAADPTGATLKFSCESELGISSRCRLAFGKGPQVQSTATTFTSAPDYLMALIREAARKSLENPSPKAPPFSDEDRAALAQVNLTGKSCFSSVEMSDLLVACSPQDSSREQAVLFIRGLCDGCSFDPIPIKRVKK